MVSLIIAEIFEEFMLFSSFVSIHNLRTQQKLFTFVPLKNDAALFIMLLSNSKIKVLCLMYKFVSCQGSFFNLFVNPRSI